MKTQKNDASVNNIWELIFKVFIKHPYLLIFGVLLVFFALLSISYMETKPDEPVKLFGYTIFKKGISFSTDSNDTSLIKNEIRGVSDIDFIVVYRAPNAGPKEGWEWINKDLNADTKKDKDPFIYLTWKKLKTSNKQNLITSIWITKSTNKETAKAELTNGGYKLIETDLNKEAGGDFIYMGYKKGEKDKAPIIDFKITYDNDRTPEQLPANRPADKRFQRINVDLNSNAGGNYIYLWFLRGEDKGTNQQIPTSSSIAR